MTGQITDRHSFYFYRHRYTLTQNVSKLYCICKTSLYCPCYFNLRIVVIFKLSAILLSVLLRISACDYPFGTVKRLANALFVLLQFTACGYPFGIFNRLDIALSVLLQFTPCGYPSGIVKRLDMALSVLLLFTASDYAFGIFKRLAILLSVCFVSHLLITPSLSSNDWPFYYLFASFHIFWLPLCYLQSFLSFICFQNLFDESMIMIIRYWDLST